MTEKSPRTASSRRIVVSADTYPPDINGMAHFTFRLSRGLAARGHDVHVLAPSTSRQPATVVEDGVTIHRVGAVRTPYHPTFRICPPWRAKRAAVALLTKLRPDVVHVQSHFMIGRALFQAKRLGIPVIATNHFMPENLFGFPRIPRSVRDWIAEVAWRDCVRVFGRADVVTTPTPRAAELLREKGLDREVIAVSCGLDVEHYRRLPAARYHDDPTTILYVGRLDEEKRIPDLLHAAANLPARLRFRIELIGDGSRRAELVDLASRLGLSDRVVFRGFVTDAELLDAYAASDIFCMPSIAELQSLATMEAMAAGNAIVAADAMALPHLVRPGENGWLYQPGSVPELTGRLTDLLSDPYRLSHMGKTSRDLVAAHDLGATLSTFEEIYRQVIPR